MNSKNLTRLSFSLLVIIFLTACSNKPTETAENKENILLCRLAMQLESSDNFQRKGEEYVLKNGEEKTVSKIILSNGKEINDVDNNWESPDEFKGEYDKFLLESINEQQVSLIYKTFLSKEGKNGYNLQQNWRFILKYSKGSYKDYLIGKTVELEFLPGEIEKYQKESIKTFNVILTSSFLCDPKDSKFDMNIDTWGIKLSKNKLSSFLKSNLSGELYVNKDLHEPMLGLMSKNTDENQ